MQPSSTCIHLVWMDLRQVLTTAGIDTSRVVVTYSTKYRPSRKMRTLVHVVSMTNTSAGVVIFPCKNQNDEQENDTQRHQKQSPFKPALHQALSEVFERGDEQELLDEEIGVESSDVSGAADQRTGGVRQGVLHVVPHD